MSGKIDLVNQLVGSIHGLSKAQAAMIVDALFGDILARLMSDEEVHIPGFGAFTLKERAARSGRNPATGETIEILVTKQIRFTPAASAKAAVNPSPALLVVPSEPGARRLSASKPRKAMRSRDTQSRVEEGMIPPEREISAWIDEREKDPEKPLQRGEAYTLRFKVGEPVEDSLLQGDTSVADGEIPPGGLNTEWVVSSDQVEISALDPEAVVSSKEIGGKTVWCARFALLIPEQGDSALRRLRVLPREAEQCSLTVLLTVERQDLNYGRRLREVYREFTIRLAVEETGTAHSALPAITVEEDVTLAPAAQLTLSTPHEWATPPGELSIVVGPGAERAYVDGDLVNGMYADEWVPWHGVAARVAGRLKSVQDSAERFRAVHEQYLDAIPADDLKQRLTQPVPTYDWSYPPDNAGPAHKQAWDGVSVSKELRDMAYDGYALFQVFFPPGSELRGWIDALPRGHQINIKWLPSTGPGWIPHVPWGLMYRQPAPAVGTPVDPMEFLGLGYRLGYTSRKVQRPSRALGGASARPTYYLYWGGASDKIEAEATRQRQDWQRQWGHHVFVPTDPQAPDAKRETLRLLERPIPGPATLLYLYCQASVGRGNEPVLQFGSSTQSRDRVDRTEWGQSPLPDRPLVFANACSTSTAGAYMSNDLEERFFERGCRAYLGTEARVPITLASRFASVFFRHFYRQVAPEPLAAGEAVSQARLFLWNNYRNIGGLLYGYVNEYRLYMADESEVKALRA